VLTGGAPDRGDREERAPRAAGLRRRAGRLLVRPAGRAVVAALAVLAVLTGAAALRADALRPAGGPADRPGQGTPAPDPPAGALGPDGRLEPDVTLMVQTDSGLVRAERRDDRVSVRRIRVGTPPSGPLDAWVTPTSTVVVVPWAGPEGGVVAMVSTGGPPVTVGPAQRVLAAPGRESLWLVRRGPGGRERVVDVDLDGTARGAARQVPAGYSAVAAVPAGIVLTAHTAEAGLALLLPGGGVRRMPVGGRVVGAAGSTVLVRVRPCGIRVVCEARAVDVRTGAAAPVLGPPGMPLLTTPVLSRDGTRIAVLVDPSRAGGDDETALAVGSVARGGADLAVVPGTTSPRRPGPDGLVVPAWSDDGRVYGALPALSTLYSYLPGEASASRYPTGAVVRRVWVV